MMVYTDDKHGSGHKIPHNAKVVIGGLCGMLTTAIVHPLDLLKVRMQIYPGTSTNIKMAKMIVRCEGISALYVGLSAGLLRQATHTTTRIGTYYWLYDEYKKTRGILHTTLPEKLVIGMYAGMAGALAGNPSEVVLVRLMADGKKNPCGDVCAPPRRYQGLLHAIYTITTTEGPRTFWRGGMLTLTRSVFVSIAQISTYTLARRLMKKLNWAEGTALHIYTSVISSFFTACLTLPVDLVKTRYQTRLAEDPVTQTELFNEILKKSVKNLWKGFLPYFIRLSLHTTLTYLFIMKINELYFIRDHNPKK